jgi:hypothetical protein
MQNAMNRAAPDVSFIIHTHREEAVGLSGDRHRMKRDRFGRRARAKGKQQTNR